jgi:TPR repeat protein
VRKVGWTSHANGIPKDEKDAVKFFSKACDGGEVQGCRALGDNYMKGTGVPKDRKAGMEIFKRACEGGDQRSCELIKEYRKTK